MTKFKQLAQDTVVRNVITEFIATQYTKNQLISETYQGVDPKSNLHYAIQLGEQIGKDIQIDMLCTYLNEHPVLKEDIFQRGLARTKAYLTTPLGRGFGDAKNQQMINNLFNTFKKNTDKIVGHGPSPFTPTEEDQKNAPARIQQISALFGKRFANIQTNPKLVKQPTSAEAQAGMGRIQQMLDKLRSSGFVKGADNVIDEIGIFARQHPVLTNSIVAGLVAVMTLVAAPGWLAGLPLLKKWVIGTALRTLIGVLKGEKPTQAAAKGAAVSGAGIAIGKLLGLFYDQLATWLSGPTDGSPLPVPQPTTPYQPVAMDVDTSNLGQEEYLSSYRGDLINKALNAASAEEYQTYIQQVKNLDAQFQFNGDIPPYDETSASGQLASPIDRGSVINPNYPSPESMGIPSAPDDSVPPGIAQPGFDQQPTATGVDIPQASAPLNLTPKINALNSLMYTYDIKGGTAQAARTAVQNWVNGMTQPEAQAMLQNPNLVNQLMRKGALGMLKQKFGINEVSVSKELAELAYLKAELMGGAAALTLVNEANPFTTAKNFMFGGPKVGGDNSRLDYKQVESDYLKFLNNMETQLGTKTEKDTLDSLKRYDKVFPGVYDYVSKVRTWLYGPGPTSNKPLPDAVVVPPNETPTPSNPNPDPTHPTDPKTIPSDPPKPGDAPVAPPTAPVPGASETELDANKIRNVKVFLSRMIDLGDVLNRTNPVALTKTALRDLATSVYTIGDVMVNKKVDGKINPIVDKATQGLDLLGAQPEIKPAKPMSNVFAEADTTAQAGYNNPELSKLIGALKNDVVFKNLAQRLGVLMAAKPNDARSLMALRSFLSSINRIISRNSAAFQQSVGNPVAVKKELESDKEYLKEATSQEIIAFNAELTKAVTNLVAVAGALRQAFNRKNPKSIYNVKGAAPASVQAAGFTPENKLVIYATKEDTGLLPSRVYQFFGGKWNIIAANGLQPLDPIGAKNAIIKLNQLAKAHRSDLDKVINLTKTNSKDKGAGVSSDVANQIKEMFGVSDYKKFFV